MAFNISAPGRAIFGEGAFDAALPFIKPLGKKALIVTGKVITKNGLADQIARKLEGVGIDSAIFNDLPGEPDDKMILSAVESFRAEKCDFIIGLGGGTPLDTAKAAAAMSVLDGDLIDWAGKEIAGKFPPLVLVPTTAGTGSEATKFFVYTDTKTDAKLLMKGDALLPALAVVDFNHTLSAPKKITIATGMDALTHAIEAYSSKKANPITDLLCLDAIGRIFKSLPAAARNGADKEARESLAIAAYEAGVAINNSSVTLVHGMSRPIGALFHVPHGMSNAMLLVECLKFALDGATERFSDIAKKIGAALPFDSDESNARNFIAALERLAKELEIPTLREYGIDLGKFKDLEPKMAKDALASGSPSNTRKNVSEEDILDIYEALRSM